MKSPTPIIVSVLAMSITMLTLDLAWLGIVMDDYYRLHLGALRATEVHVPAAIAFYLLYLSATLWISMRAGSEKEALFGGAALGFYAYGVYELTNWAVIEGWPAALVAPDWIWGVVLTASVTWVGRRSADTARRLLAR